MHKKKSQPRFTSEIFFYFHFYSRKSADVDETYIFVQFKLCDSCLLSELLSQLTQPHVHYSNLNTRQILPCDVTEEFFHNLCFDVFISRWLLVTIRK